MNPIKTTMTTREFVEKTKCILAKLNEVEQLCARVLYSPEATPEHLKQVHEAMQFVFTRKQVVRKIVWQWEKEKGLPYVYATWARDL